jgi:hypothetical protein
MSSNNKNTLVLWITILAGIAAISGYTIKYFVDKENEAKAVTGSTVNNYYLPPNNNSPSQQSTPPNNNSPSPSSPSPHSYTPPSSSSPPRKSYSPPQSSSPSTQENDLVEVSVNSYCEWYTELYIYIDDVFIGVAGRDKDATARKTIKSGTHTIQARNELKLLVYEKELTIDKDNNVIHIDYCSPYELGRGLIVIKNSSKKNITVTIYQGNPVEIKVPNRNYKSTGKLFEDFDPQYMVKADTGRILVSAISTNGKGVWAEQEFNLTDAIFTIFEFKEDGQIKPYIGSY